MWCDDDLRPVLRGWRSAVGRDPAIGAAVHERELWPVNGADGGVWFLKRLGPWRNLPVEDEARVLDHLCAAGIPAAPFVRRDDGAIVGGEPADSFVLMPRVPALQLGPSATAAAEPLAGAAVARMHRALAAYPRGTASYTEQIGRTLGASDRLPNDLAVAVRRHGSEIGRRLEALPKVLVHGDLTPDNVLRAADGSVAGFIDFDHLPLAPRVWDLAKYLSRRLRARWRPGADRTDGLASFLAGYRAVEPLGPDELAILPGAVLAQNLIEADYGRKVLDGVLPRPMYSDHEAVLADAEATARWHVGHRDVVRDALLDGVPTGR